MRGRPAADGAAGGVGGRLRTALGRAVRVAVGDRGGAVVFLASVLFLGLLWRVGFFITDSTTVANAVANVLQGRLSIVDVPYSLTAGGQPGLVEVDGRPYARNYGHVYLAAALHLALAVPTAVVPTSLVLLGGWCLGLVGLSRALARLVDRPRLEPLGSALALVVLVGSLPALSSIPPARGPLVALQLSTILATAAAGTLVYRLLAHLHDRRVGLVAGAFAVAATPLGFWGSIPKRHAVTAALVLAAIYCFAVSRTSGGWRVRATGYAAIGLLSAVHAFEAAFLLLAFAPIDLLSAPRNDRRTLVLVGAVFLASTAPMLATNAAISGNPLEPPRLLSDASQGGFPADPGDAGGLAPADAGGETGTAPPPGDDGRAGDRLPGWLAPLGRVLGQVAFVLGFTIDSAVAGLAAATEPDRLFHVVVRSGWNPFVSYHVTEFEAIDLALLEVVPLAGALAYVPVAGIRRLRDRATTSIRAALADPVRQTDVLVATVAVTLVVVYLPRLPLHSQITLRYVVPVVGLLVYGVVRLEPVRRAIAGAPAVLAGGYLAAVVGATAALSLSVLAVDPAVGEALQLQALVGLASACLAAAVVGSWPLHGSERAVALGVALPAGATTAFLALSSLSYFPYGRHALDAARVVAELLPAVG